MRRLVLLVPLLFLGFILSAQYVYIIKADSVKLTNCDSTELIIENHTQNVQGFLFNTGRGRTVFKKAVQQLNDSLFQIGGDTLKIPGNFWSLSGNSSIDPLTQFIGTSDLNPLVFRTGAVERMRLASNGNVTINSSGADTGYKFWVRGNTYGLFADGMAHRIGNLAVTQGRYSGSAGTNTGIRIDDIGNSSFMLEGTNQGWAADMFTFTTGFGNITKDLYNQDGSIVKILSGFHGANVGNLSGNVLSVSPTYDFNNPDVWPMTLRGIYYNPVLTNLGGSRHIAIETVSGDVLLGTTSGNTGIGTNTPTAQLHTTGSVRFAGLTNDTTKTRVIVSDANGNLYYRDASTLAGNGILNSSLAVNGTISAQRLKLSPTGWPDYVFDSSYRLPDLKETEQYIKRYNHLPGIAAAKEVESKGIDVGDHQAALLKKIEELTLYAIDQNKKLEAQEKELNTLEQEIIELKNMINNKSLK